ncbi:MAG: thiamine phosphate synthase [Candidatus Acidiferrales bacterium]
MFFWRSKRFAAGLPPLQPTPKPPIICYVTSRVSLGSEAPITGLLERIRAAIEAGADWVQIREKDLPARELLTLAREGVSAGAPRNLGIARKAAILINDRLDVALAAGASGVHLGRESAPAREVVRWCRAGNAPADFRIGVSSHSLEETREAESAGADYVFFGPVYETPSKRRFGAAQGIGRLVEVCRSVRIPVIAIGGVNEENAAECITAGAAGIAAIRMFQEVTDAQALKEAVGRLHLPAL